MGIDPGLKAPFTAVVHSAAAEASNVHYEVITARKKEWNAKLGFTRYTRKIGTWIANDPAVKAFNETVASAKTASLAITTVLEASQLYCGSMWNDPECAAKSLESASGRSKGWTTLPTRSPAERKTPSLPLVMLVGIHACEAMLL